MNDSIIEEEYYIVFRDSDYRHWMLRFLKPGFKHVFAMKKTEYGNFWQVIDPSAAGLYVYQILVSECPTPRDLVDDSAQIIQISVKIDTMKPRRKIGIFNCVEVVKALLGIDNYVMTPWQLFKYLESQHE